MHVTEFCSLSSCGKKQFHFAFEQSWVGWGGSHNAEEFSSCNVHNGGKRDFSDLLSSTLPVRHTAVIKMDDVQVPEK